MSGGSAGRGAYSGMGEGKLVLVGTRGGHGDLDATHRDAHLSADLQELEADAGAGGDGEVCMGEPDAAHGAHEYIGEGSEPQAQLVGTHGPGAGTVGIKVELTLLDGFSMSPRAQ